MIPGYELISELGRGGMGVVWLARQTALDRRVALKQILKTGQANADLARFRREGKLLRDLRHPGLVRLLDYDLDAAEPYLVLEYVENARTLLDVLRDDRPDPTRALALATGVAEALGYVHARGIVHRDVKPGNVLVGHDGRPRLIDLGLARSLNADETARLTRTGEVAGTMAYMAPEQLVGDPVDARADVYAFGLVLYELLARRFVFAAAGTDAVPALLRLSDRWPPVTHYEPTVHPALQVILARCLALSPVARYPDCGAVAEALAAVQAPRPSPRVRASRRRAAPPIAGAVVLTGVALAAALAAFGPRRPAPVEVHGFAAQSPAPEAAPTARLSAALAAARPRLDERALATFGSTHRAALRGRDRSALARAVAAELDAAGVRAALVDGLPHVPAWLDDPRATPAERWARRASFSDLELWELFCREHGLAWPLPSVRLPGGAWDVPVDPATVDLGRARHWVHRASWYETRFADGPSERAFPLPAGAGARRALLWFSTTAWRPGLVLEVTVNHRFRRLLAFDLPAVEPAPRPLAATWLLDGAGEHRDRAVSVLGDPTWNGRRGYLGIWLPPGLLGTAATLRCRVIALPGASAGMVDPALRERVISLF